MKDKTIYYTDPALGLLQIKIPFKQLWDASREGMDVPPEIRLEHIQDCVKAGKQIDVMVASILHWLCFMGEKPKGDVLYFHNPFDLN
jgi:hypothetical protein